MTQPFHDIPIASVIVETRDARSYVLAIPEPLRPQFAYRAGQFLTFELPWDDFAIHRCYSLSSAPETDEQLKLTVKRVPDGRASNWMIDHLGPGDTLRVRPPEGRFVLDRATGDGVPLTLIGAGSGITPLISLLKSALNTTGRPVQLIYANRDAASIVFAAELAALAERFPTRFALHHHLDSERGFLQPSQLRALIAARRPSEVYVCGPTPFMEMVAQTLEPSERAHFERFVSPTDPDRRPAVEADAPLAAPPSFTVCFDGEDHTVPYRPGASLLACAKEAGLAVPHACEEGFCGCCMAQLQGGRVRMDSQKALSKADLSAGRILLCQARPIGEAPIVVQTDSPSRPEAQQRGPVPISRTRVALVVAIGVALAALVRFLH